MRLPPDFNAQAWDVARMVAETDEQLLSSHAVNAFAMLAFSARKQAAMRCLEIVNEIGGTATGAAMRIRTEFGLDQ